MREILVVKLSSIGDTVHAVPAVAALKRTWPDARLTWCVERRCAGLVRCLECVDRLVTVDTRAWRHGRALRGENGPGEFWRSLRDRKYDVCVDFQGLLKSAILCSLSGSARRVGWGAALLREPLAARFYHERVEQVPAGAHVIEWCAALAERIGVSGVPRVFPYRFPASAEQGAMSFLNRWGLDDFVILNPGAGWPTKRWPPENFARLGSRIRASLGLRAIITYGPGEEDLMRRVVSLDPDLIPAPLSIQELAVVCRQAMVFVGGDTGPMHLASAVGTPVVALFGPTDPCRNGPFHAADIALSRGLPCSACHARECGNWRCLDFSVDEVFDAVKQRIGR